MINIRLLCLWGKWTFYEIIFKKRLSQMQNLKMKWKYDVSVQNNYSTVL